jgi:hypothetical protein
MNNTFTLNSQVFNKTKNPTPSSVEFITRGRGQTLPDKLTIAHKWVPNVVESGSQDKLTKAEIAVTYVNADGVVKQLLASMTLRTPDDAPTTEVALAKTYLNAFLNSAVTPIAANIAALDNGEIA